MFSKTKKMLPLLLLIFMGLIMVGCGEEKKEEPVVPVNPTAIAIVKGSYYYPNANSGYNENREGVLINGDAMELLIDATPVGAVDAVNWTSSDPAIATVNANGEVTGVSGGEVTITATSKADANIKDAIKVFVFEDEEAAAVLVKTINYLKEAIPEYAVVNSSRMTEVTTEDNGTEEVEIDVIKGVLPVYPNKTVTVKYFTATGRELENNEFAFDYVRDCTETLKCQVSYETKATEFSFSIRLVDDEEDNDFVYLDRAKDEITKFMSDYTGDKKYAETVELPLSLSALMGEQFPAGSQDVLITWTSDVPTTIKDTGEFVRPNDDTVVNLQAYMYTCEDLENDLDGNSASKIYIVTANGYSKEEKLAYIKEEVLPKVLVLNGSNILLPSGDTKFGSSFTWTSSDAQVLTAKGFMNGDITEQKKVTLTVEVTYKPIMKYVDDTTKPIKDKDGNNVLDDLGNITYEKLPVYSTASFNETIPYEFTVNPPANDAQREVLNIALRLSEGEDMLTNYFPYGVKDRVGGNTLKLLDKIGGTGAHKDVVINWTCSEEGLFNENWELQKQYLRYHEVKLTYGVTIDSTTATGEFAINVGIGQKQLTANAGGRWVAGQKAKDLYTMFDGVNTLSRVDGKVGTQSHADASYAPWAGITFYTDINGVRYQYFADDAYTWILTEDNCDIDADGNFLAKGASITKTPVMEDDGVTQKKDEAGKPIFKYDYVAGTPFTAMDGKTTHGNYQYFLFKNDSEKDVRLPISFLNYKGSSYQFDANGVKVSIRQTNIAIDGWRFFFVTDATGKVIDGAGDTAIETQWTNIAAEKFAKPEDIVLQDYVVVPAGGWAYSPFTNQNTPAFGQAICNKGVQLTFEYYNVK